MTQKSLLFTGGSILTMREQMEAEAVVVQEEKVTFVGSLEDAKIHSGNNYETIDLQGQCLVPGFIDPHVHVMMLGMCNTWADVSYPKVKNMDDLVAALQEHAKLLPAGATIRGFGFDKRQLEEERYPTAKDLDRVSTEQPVQIMNGSGHCNVVNTLLMNRIGITKDTEDPEGAHLVEMKTVILMVQFLIVPMII